MSDWKGKIVVVTGGSDGLGKVIVGEFAARGATVVSIARNEERNSRNAIDFQTAGMNVEPIQADVTSDSSIDSAIKEVLHRFGRIDVWINNVGRSTRANVADATVEQFKDLMEINFYAVVRCCKSVLPHVIKSNGHIVNIGSLASRTAWPLVAPYSASKHAMAVYSDQLRIEMGDKVHVLHVCPGPILRPEDQNSDRYSEQSKSLPESARKPGAGAPVKGIPAGTVAAKIVRACEKRKSELVIPWKAKLLFIASRISSSLGDWFIKRSKRT